MTSITWLDFDCYAYIIHAIVKATGKNFIGIVATKEAYSFFEKQNYEKLYFYPDCYASKKYDRTEFIKEANDIKISWADLYSERSFYKYWTDFYNFSEDEMFSIVYHSIIFFKNMLKLHKPEFIIAQQIGENISNIVLYRVAKQMNIPIISLNQVYTHDRIIISESLTSSEISSKYLQTTDKNKIRH